MGRIIGNWRILGATLLAVALIVGSYLAAKGAATPPVAQASTETALLQAIATRDSDNDGLPDWEEALYGTSPTNSDTFKLGMTDGQAVAKGLVVPKAIADIPIASSTPSGRIITDPSLPIPAEGTLTTAFAKTFFTLYIEAVQKSGDGNLSQSAMQSVATEALTELTQSIMRSRDYKSVQDITVEGSGQDAMREYAVAAEGVFLANKAEASKSELFYLKDILENNDTTAITHIASIAKVYRTTAAGLAVLPVPSELSSEHLALINTMSRLGAITEDFTRVNSDPLATMLALQQYPQVVLNFGNTFIELSKAYRAAGVTLKAGEPGASLVNLIGDVAADQKATNKP